MAEKVWHSGVTRWHPLAFPGPVTRQVQHPQPERYMLIKAHHFSDEGTVHHARKVTTREVLAERKKNVQWVVEGGDTYQPQSGD